MIERLSSDVLEIELAPSVGGRCQRVRAFGRDLLRTDDGGDQFFWGWYSLVPWSNRIPDGKLVWEGDVLELPSNYDDGSALHGHAYAAPWRLDGPGDYAFVHDAGAWPWAYTARQLWSLEGGDTLVQRLSVRNVSERPMPAGLGIHPWWTAEGGLTVEVPSRAAYECEGGLAVGEPFAAQGPTGPVPWGTDQLFTDLASSAVVLRWPEWGIEATLAFSEAARHVHLAAFERVNAVAVEPITHAGDGHRRLAEGQSGGIDVLQPGESLAVEYRLTVRQA